MQTFYTHIRKNKKISFIFKFIFVLGYLIIATVMAEIIAGIITIHADPANAAELSRDLWLGRLAGYLFVGIIIYGSYVWHKNLMKKGVNSLFESMGHINLQVIFDNLLLEKDKMSISLSDYQYDIFRLITPESCKVLSNIVEEMAIAANVKRPEIYVDLTNTRINACTMGLDRNEAGISVSYGALTKLTRDEMQGVIAHEFSHICNGDTETNMKAVAAISGMTIIADIGTFIMETRSQTSSAIIDSEDRKNALYASFLIGSIGCVILGAGIIGMIFGEFMKRSVSRSNEYIADATAVKYTRNPAGLIGALLKIANETHAFRFGTSPYSHMYFAPAFSEIFDTHPSIKNRIQALESIVGHGEVQETARKVYEELKRKPPKEIPDALHVIGGQSAQNCDNIELNKAILAATVVAQTYDMNLIPGESDDSGINSANFSNLAQATCALVRLVAQDDSTVTQLANTAPTNFKRELNRGRAVPTDDSTIFNVINKCRAFYKLSAELIQTQARTIINNLIKTEPQNLGALALNILFTTEMVDANNKFEEPVYKAMVPRLFGFLLQQATKVPDSDFLPIYTKCLKECGLEYTDYIPFPLTKLKMVLTSFCELDLKHFRMVTNAIDTIYPKSEKHMFSMEAQVIRALLESHCTDHEATEYAIDASEAVIIKEQMRSVSDIMQEAGLEEGQTRQTELEQKRTYNTFLKIMGMLVQEPDNLIALSNIYDHQHLSKAIAELKHPKADTDFNMSEEDLNKLIYSFKQSYDAIDIGCKRGMHIAFQRLFNLEPQNSKLAYFSLVIDLREILNSNYVMPEDTFANLCIGLYNYLATNSTPTNELTRQDFLNTACDRASIQPQPYKPVLIKSIFANLLELRTATREQKERFKQGFNYIIKADNDITADERFLNNIISIVIC